ncbi:competence protein ComGC [Lactobacillus colini]|uniref:Competence protein ComGC n=1 Tax=Lactobacillus colini TaxID=1819254 RepID=A0ABS4MDV2_9LACO|nr:prepilin-type N-terminal cleavage/methylation domain-containing protein [Lactobacillus colini]MBP2057870.1 competence protein ComGC [Lactobacillus colini]
MKTKIKSLLKNFKKAKGFTLIEMVVVIAIIAILILLVVPNLSTQRKKAEDRTEEAFKTTLQTQVELSGKENPSWDDLKEEKLITDKQYDRAIKNKYEIKDGIVKGPEN